MIVGIGTVTNVANADLTAVGEVLVDRVESRDHPGGSPLNVSLAAARLGLAVQLVGRVGDDVAGHAILAQAKASGVDVTGVEVADRPTSIATSRLDADGRAHYEFDFDTSAALRFTGASVNDVPLGRVLHTGSIAAWHPLSAAPLKALQQRAFTAGVLVSFDPNPRPTLIGDRAAIRAAVTAGVQQAHLVKASDEDLGVLYPGVALGDVAADYCRLGALLVLVTRGPEGAIAFGADGRVAHVPAPRTAVVDTVGAGDAFTGALLAAITDRGIATPDAIRAAVAGRADDLHAAMAQAVLVAAMTCERAGADPPTRREVEARTA